MISITQQRICSAVLNFPGIPVGFVKKVDNSTTSLGKTASVGSYSQLSSLGVVTVVLDAGKGDPHDALVPKPEPVATIWVTATGSPDTATATVPPSPSKATPLSTATKKLLKAKK